VEKVGCADGGECSECVGERVVKGKGESPCHGTFGGYHERKSARRERERGKGKKKLERNAVTKKGGKKEPPASKRSLSPRELMSTSKKKRKKDARANDLFWTDAAMATRKKRGGRT